MQILQKKASKRERKKQNQVQDQRIVQHVNEQMASNITLVTLAGYQRKRMAMSVENDTTQPPRRKEKPLTSRRKPHLGLQRSPTGLTTVASRCTDQLE